ncbi:MAG: RNA-guided endonuclease InsQ/TnpB family protein [Candidatus Berkiellales bacterium]
MLQRKVTYRLYPTPTQLKCLENMLGVHQRLYNKALEQRIKAYQENKISISFYDQCRFLTQWRKEDAALEEVNAQSAQVTLKRLALAFDGFFRRVKNGETPGFPRFKAYRRFSGWGYKTHGDGFRLQMKEGLKHGKVKLSGIGNIIIRGKARTPGMPKTTEVLHKVGRWYLAVTINCEPIRKCGVKAIGLDWGVETFATVVDNQNSVKTIENPRLGKQVAEQIKEYQQAIAKSQKGSKNRGKRIKKLARVYSDLTCRRKEFIHQETAKIVKETCLIATEDLNIRAMTAKGGSRKKGLNREILNTTPGAFFNLLKCKAEEAGIQWVEVPTREVKPSQTCHRCGVQKKKALSERWHECPCGASCSRDENAARVILNWALYGNATGQELSEVWSGRSFATMKQETPSVELAFS